MPVACFTGEVNPSLVKPPIKSEGGLTKLGQIFELIAPWESWMMI